MKPKEVIVRRIAKELKKGDVVNLGIGLPTMVANYVSDDMGVILQSENGFIGLGVAATENTFNRNIVNAGGQPVTVKTGAAFFDSATSFGIIRGGHVNATVLGALEVDEEGNLANYVVPGKMVPGMGGAMDLVCGAKRVIIGMQHTDNDGNSKILKKCTLPLTAQKEVDLIVTEIAVIEMTDKGLLLTEIAEGLTVEDVVKKTEATLLIADEIKIMDIS